MVGIKQHKRENFIKMKKAPISILMSALNEERNIVNILGDLLAQKESNFYIKEILIASDGSTDDTVKLINNFKDSRIVVFDYSSRKGKSHRLSQLFSKAKGDILVQVDADITLGGKLVIQSLVEPFLKDKKVGMTGGNSLPHAPVNFVQKMIASSIRPYAKLRKRCRSLSVGPLLAFRRKVARSIKYPENIVGEDVYSFFSCLVQGFEYQYAEEATCYYKLPSSFKEHIKQNVRFLEAPTRMTSYFPKRLVAQEDYVPAVPFYLYLFVEFVLHPILSCSILIINFYCRILVKVKGKNLTSSWTIAVSSK
jgi:cellulose synthase/poly-beta-1,6-N-acetylglucosamine synthase-like glycosyltransferase